MTERQRIGRDAEDRAAAVLARHGLRLVTRNYRTRAGEIDLVMRDGDQLVFVEVRRRSHTGFGGALASIDARKQHRLALAASHYLTRHGWSGPCRFDVVGFDGSGEAQWVRDAFGV